MAGNESCIYHPERDPFLIIRRHYLEMFCGDVDLAALVSLFEFLTNGELNQFDKKKENGIPWIQIGMPVIEERMMNICGRRKIQDKLAILDELGILRSTSPGCQTIKSYLLNIDGLNSMVKSGYRVDPAVIGRNADQARLPSPQSQEVIGRNADQSQDMIGKNDRSNVVFADQNDPVSLLCLKKEEKKEEHTPSLGSTNPENQNQPPEVPPAPTIERMYETLQPSMSGKRNWKRPKPERPHGASDRLREMREAKATGAQDTLPSITGPSQAVPGQMYDPERPWGSHPIFTVRWNQIVPERPVDPKLLSPNPRAYRDPVFVERFEEICQKAKALIAAGASLEFGFLLSQDKSTEQYRWQQLLAGQLEWMKPRPNGGGKSKTPAADSQRWAAEMRKDLEEKRANESRARELAKETDKTA